MSEFIDFLKTDKESQIIFGVLAACILILIVIAIITGKPVEVLSILFGMLIINKLLKKLS